MQTVQATQARTKIITVIVAIIVVAGVVLVADQLKAKQTSTTATLPTANQTIATKESVTTDSAATSTTQTYKDGTYTANSSYFVPHGNQSIEVTLTLKQGVITDTSVKNSKGDNVSANYQEAFTAKFKPLVVGKNIGGLKIDTVAGASDTVDGFNEALAKIEQQAKA